MYLPFFLNLFVVFCNSNYGTSSQKKNNFIFSKEAIEINIRSISYELTYDKESVIKVNIKTNNKINYSINFNGFLKSENELNGYILHCFNKHDYLIICKSEKNIILNTKNKYFFYYKKENLGSQITFNTKDSFEDNRRISLIFHPKVPSHQLLFRNYRRFIVKHKENTISGGYLYILRKFKKILKKPKNGFNKNIELNNFIYSGGFESHFPPWSLINYKEAIRKGYKIVDADIMFTKDKIPVISHDRQLKEISNGNGDLTKKTIEELNKLDFGIINCQY